VTRTLSARYHKDGSEILVHQGEGLRPRRLTPRECARLMGFPDTFRIPVSDTQAYRQFGNSVVMPVMREVARTMMPHLDALLAGSASKTLARAPAATTTATAAGLTPAKPAPRAKAQRAAGARAGTAHSRAGQPVGTQPSAEAA
jgi:DNA (cytosine-5)-methyltransferase 1